MATGSKINWIWRVVMGLGAVLYGSVMADDASARNVATGQVLAQVNGHPLTRLQYDEFVRFLVAKGAIPRGIPVNRDFVLDSLIDEEVLAQEAVRRGLEREPRVLLELDVMRRDVLARHVRARLRSVSDFTAEELKRIYSRVKNRLWPKEYALQEIVVTTETAAVAVETAFAQGMEFGRVARVYSQAASAVNGGWRNAVFSSAFPPAVAAALGKLAPGARTRGAVRANGRWYWLLLKSVRKPMRPPISEVTERLRRYAAEKGLADRIRALRRSADIKKSGVPQW